jgi:hypothetical protein
VSRESKSVYVRLVIPRININILFSIPPRSARVSSRIIRFGDRIISRGECRLKNIHRDAKQREMVARALLPPEYSHVDFTVLIYTKNRETRKPEKVREGKFRHGGERRRV